MAEEKAKSRAHPENSADKKAQEDVQKTSHEASESVAESPELQEARRKAEEYLDLLQRVQAEFANYRKRVERERLQIYNRAKGEVIKKMLPVLDDFERLLQTAAQDGEIKKGAELIYQNMMNIFRSEGLESYTEPGDSFDPYVHEAVSVEAVPAEKDGRILEIWQKGYRFKGEILRPARVKVGQAQREEKQSQDSGDPVENTPKEGC